MSAAIEIDSVSKRFGDTLAVNNLDLTVEAGQVFGFLGPNGAGKSTTLKLIIDLIRPTSGSIRIFGEYVLNNPQVRNAIGYVPGEVVLWDTMTGRQIFEFFKRLRGLPDISRAEELASKLNVDLDKHIRSLSRGNKQKIALIQSLMHRPQLLLLDEPTSGLDPIVQQEFAELIKEHVTNGGTVFLSSHVLSEVQHVAQIVGIIRSGRLVAVENIDALRAKSARRMKIRFTHDPPSDAISNVPGVRELSTVSNTVNCMHAGRDDELIKLLANYQIESFESSEPDLEDLFLAYYTNGSDDV